ncbi:MAG: glycosyltransferase family 2 protein [Pseudomonadota bacterium]
MTPPLSVIVPAYNAADLIEATLTALHTQTVSAEIIVVDDASNDATANRVSCYPDVHLCRLPRNLGRSGARNAGAALATTEVLLFLDCDCVPVGTGFLAAHLALHDGTVEGTCGGIEALGQSFWARYQNRPAAPQAEPVPLAAFSSANFSIRRSLFERLGGFDVGYRGYGFEDRDLYARLLACGGTLLSAPAARVQHMDYVHLAHVWQRLQECGATSADRFRAAHPLQYRRMSYSRLDAGEHLALWPVGRSLGFLLPPTLAIIERLLQVEVIPFALRRAVAKAYAAAAFLHGTTRRSEQPG